MYDIEILSIFDFYPKKKYQFVLNQIIRIKEGACIDNDHLELQANPKKLYKKTDAIFSIYGRNGIIPWHFL